VSGRADPEEGRLLSFAAITHDPPPEIKSAGHDRCIINLRRENVEAWLSPAGRKDVGRRMRCSSCKHWGASFTTIRPCGRITHSFRS
jgi:putative SOS response-associated peptidase YedK